MKPEPFIADSIMRGAAAHGSDGKGKDGVRGYLEMCAARFQDEYQRLEQKLDKLLNGNDGARGPALASRGRDATFVERAGNPIRTGNASRP